MFFVADSTGNQGRIIAQFKKYTAALQMQAEALRESARFHKFIYDGMTLTSILNTDHVSH